MASFVHPTLGLLGLIPQQPKAPFREVLGWFTDIAPAYDGSETRTAYRRTARQRFTPKFTAQPTQAQDVFNTVYGGMVRRWGIPVWSEAAPAGTVAATDVVIGCETRYSDFRVDAPVLVWGLCGNWFVGIVEGKTDATLTLTTGAPLGVRGAVAVPLRVGRLTSNGRRTAGGYDQPWELTFDVDDTLELTSAAPAQYFGEDIYLTPTLFSGDRISQTISTEPEEFDFDIGAVKTYTGWINNRVSRPYNVITETPAEAWELRKWLHRRAGRYRAFWLPTFLHDVRLAQAGAVAGTVLVQADGRNPWASNRLNLAFGMRDGTWLPRRVTADAAATSTTRQLTLNTPLNVAAEDILTVSYMGLNRLDADNVSLDWIGNGRCDLSVPVLELSP